MKVRTTWTTDILEPHEVRLEHETGSDTITLYEHDVEVHTYEIDRLNFHTPQETAIALLLLHEARVLRQAAKESSVDANG